MFASDDVNKQPYNIWKPLTERHQGRQILGRILLSRKQNCCHKNFHSFKKLLQPIPTETYNHSRIYFALEITQSKSTRPI